VGRREQEKRSRTVRKISALRLVAEWINATVGGGIWGPPGEGGGGEVKGGKGTLESGKYEFIMEAIKIQQNVVQKGQHMDNPLDVGGGGEMLEERMKGFRGGQQGKGETRGQTGGECRGESKGTSERYVPPSRRKRSPKAENHAFEPVKGGRKA